MSNIGERLREERERLGYSQTAFGELGGVKKLSQINYEKGVSYPTAAYLECLAKVGADVMYIVTGSRGGVVLTVEETKLLDNYRHSAGPAKAALRATSHALAKHDCSDFEQSA